MDAKALWLTRKQGPFEVGPGPDTTPRATEVVVLAQAIAVNPVDRYLPLIGNLITPWLQYPAVLGSDVAGEVVAVGSEVTRFKPGDRIVDFAAGTDKGHRAGEGAVQERVVLRAHMTSPIPDSLPFENGRSAAACANPSSTGRRSSSPASASQLWPRSPS